MRQFVILSTLFAMISIPIHKIYYSTEGLLIKFNFFGGDLVIRFDCISMSGLLIIRFNCIFMADLCNDG